jgi:hypothetical protein
VSVFERSVGTTYTIDEIGVVGQPRLVAVGQDQRVAIVPGLFVGEIIGSLHEDGRVFDRVTRISDESNKHLRIRAVRAIWIVEGLTSAAQLTLGPSQVRADRQNQS